jgi:exopolysaccharide biosynthesis WecB/TagA/CpsF family protein
MSANSFVARPKATPSLPEVVVNFDRLDTAVATALERARAGEGFCLYTLNLDHLLQLQSDERFRKAYAAAEFISADGWPIVWLLRRQGFLVERASGADLVEPLLARAAQHGIGVYLLGPERESQTRAVEVLSERYPNLAVVGAETPILPIHAADETILALAERINGAGARICVVSLGSPKQELLAAELREHCPAVGFLCVGAAIDFISNHCSRAPAFWQQNGLEWLWRVGCEPRRLGMRYMRGGGFFARILVAALRGAPAREMVRGAPNLPLDSSHRLPA